MICLISLIGVLRRTQNGFTYTMIPSIMEAGNWALSGKILDRPQVAGGLPINLSAATSRKKDVITCVEYLSDVEGCGYKIVKKNHNKLRYKM